MASSGKKIGRALVAGLQTFTATKALSDKEEFERKQLAKQEERLQRQEGRADRQLELQEKQFLQQQETAKLNLAMQKVEHNNKMLINNISGSNWDEAVVAKALTDYGPVSGRVFVHNRTASADVAKLTNNPGAIVYDVGVYETNREGNPTLGEDGKFKFKRLAGDSGSRVFANKDELVKFVSPMLHPQYMFGNMLKNQTAEETYQKSLEFAEKFKDTPKARGESAVLRTKEAEADIQQEKARRVKAGLSDENPPASPPASEVTSLTGRVIKRTTSEAQQDLETLRIIGERYGDVDNVQQAFWLTEIKQNKAINESFMTGIQQLVEGKLTREQFNSQLDKVSPGISRQFVDEMVKQAELDKGALKQPGWFGRQWNKIFK